MDMGEAEDEAVYDITFDCKARDEQKYVDAEVNAKNMLRKCYSELRKIKDDDVRKEIARMLKETDLPLYDNWHYTPILYYEGFQMDDTEGDDITFEPISNNCSLEQMVIEENLIDITRDMIAKLSPVEQEVITLYYFEQKTLEESGKIINKAANRVHEIRERALKKLKKLDISLDIKAFINEITDWNDTIYKPVDKMLPIAEYIPNASPCKLMGYLHNSFHDKATVCPGAYAADSQTLICSKKLYINNPENIPKKHMTIQKVAEALFIGKNEIEKLRDIGRLPLDTESKQNNINGKDLVDCQNEVYFKGRKSNKKYWCKRKQFKDQRKYIEINHPNYNCHNCSNRCSCIAGAGEYKWKQAWPNSDLCVRINYENKYLKVS